MNSVVSRQIRESGLVEAAFGNELEAPLGGYVFRIDRNASGDLMLVAKRGGSELTKYFFRLPLKALEESSDVVLSPDQWELADTLAVDV